MDLQLVNKELSEAKLFRSSGQFKNLTGKEIANMLYLNTLVTFLLSQDEIQERYAIEYAKDTSRHGNYNLFRTAATDLYMLAYQVHHPENDHARLSRLGDAKQYLKGLNFSNRMHHAFMREIAAGKASKERAGTYLYRLENQLKVTDSKYKRWRRLATDWRNLKYAPRQAVIAQIVQELRKIGKGAGVNSQIMTGLKPMLKYKSYKDTPVAKDNQPSATRKVAGALAGAVAGRYAASKLNKASNKTAKNVGTGIGAIAGYWAAGRSKK